MRDMTVTPAARPGADCPVCRGRDPQCLVRLTAERRAGERPPEPRGFTVTTLMHAPDPAPGEEV